MFKDELSDDSFSSDEQPCRDEDVALPTAGAERWGKEDRYDPNPGTYDHVFASLFDVVEKAVDRQRSQKAEERSTSQEHSEAGVLPL